jgi:DNA-binding MarR family transcriptional regulator
MSNLVKFNSPQRKSPKDLVVRKPLNLAEYLPYRVFKLTQDLAFRGKVVVNDISLSMRDWRILALLAATGPKTNKELADEIGLDSTTISRAVQHLKKAGVIDVRRSKRDRRIQLIALTQKGADAHDALSPERKRFADEIESCLTIKEREGLYLALDKIDAFFAEQRIEHDEWE